MKTPRISVWLALSALAFATLPTFAQPDPNRGPRPELDRPRANRPNVQPGRPGAMRPQVGFIEQALTEDQRQSMRESMQVQREKLRELQEKILAARKDLMTTALTMDFKEEAIKAKALEIAKMEAEVNLIRLKALAEVQPPLTEDQVEKMINPPPLNGMRPEDNAPGRNDRMERRQRRKVDGGPPRRTLPND